MRDRFDAVIFDMDGVLIDSEPLWRRAEREVFGTVGIELTEANCRLTMGLRTSEVVDYWYERQPWSPADLPTLARRIDSKVAELIESEGEALPGARVLPARLRGEGFQVGLATSSAPLIIDAVLRRLGLETTFEVRCSALDDPRGKPAPDVYLRAAHALGVAPGRCVAIEDSMAGVRSARAAGMFVVAIPAPEQAAMEQFEEADLRIGSLEELGRRF